LLGRPFDRWSQNGLNVFGTCHGGVLFTLAETALSIACNSHGRQSVAQQCSITFVRPVRPGDRLIVHALERCRASRTAIYDFTVTNAGGKIVAEFRAIRGQSPTRCRHNWSKLIRLAVCAATAYDSDSQQPWPRPEIEPPGRGPTRRDPRCPLPMRQLRLSIE